MENDWRDEAKAQDLVDLDFDIICALERDRIDKIREGSR